MSLFDVWTRFGFRANPYSQATLTADAEGDRLIAGRDSEIGVIQRKIGSSGAIPSIEGPIGAGKTSLINVAVYRMATACIAARNRELYLPATRTFQPLADASTFEFQLFAALGRTLIENLGTFSEVGLLEPQVSGWAEWLTSPTYYTWSAGGQILGFGGEAGGGAEPNTSDGYSVEGFQAAVRAELARVFPTGTGGIVCVLDNLEVLETTGRARSTLDELRDRVFNIQGVRWVLCGSRGIVSRARTERLSGFIQLPDRVKPLDDSAAVDAIRRRIEHYGGPTAVPPVSPEGFEFIYKALHRNLRDSMEHAQGFAAWAAREYLDTERELPAPDDLDKLLETWLLERAESAYQDASGVQRRVWQFFSDLCEAGGRAGSDEFHKFDFNKQQQLTSSVSALVDVNLVVRESDPDNGKKTINSVTAVGWLIYFYKEEFSLLASDA